MFYTEKELKIKVKLLKDGAVFAYPTDTVWGVGCLPENEEACQKIYNIKHRDGAKPLILMGADIESFLPYITEFPQIAKNLAAKYWPGALTIILPKSEKTADFITSGMNTVGLRIPNHPVLLEFLKLTGPIATTSANLSGEPAALNLEQTQKYLGDKIDFVLKDFGHSAEGIASTVILLEQDKIKILRQGIITPEQEKK